MGSLFGSSYGLNTHKGVEELGRIGQLKSDSVTAKDLASPIWSCIVRQSSELSQDEVKWLDICTPRGTVTRYGLTPERADNFG